MATKSVSVPTISKTTKIDQNFSFEPFKVTLARRFSARVTEKIADDVYLMRDTEQLAVLYQVLFHFLHKIRFWCTFLLPLLEDLQLILTNRLNSIISATRD